MCIKETRRGKCCWSPLLGSCLSYTHVTFQKHWAYFPFSHLLNAKSWLFFNYISPLFKSGPWFQTFSYSSWKFSRSWAVHLQPFPPPFSGEISFTIYLFMRKSCSENLTQVRFTEMIVSLLSDGALTSTVWCLYIPGYQVAFSESALLIYVLDYYWGEGGI